MYKQENIRKWAACFAVVLGVVIMAAALFVPPVLGSADNGELTSVIEGNGLYKLDHGKKDEYFAYASVKYGVKQYHNEYRPVFTSRNLFIQLAKGLNYLFGKNKMIFDIRFYSVLLCIYTLGGIYLLVEYAAGKYPKGSFLIALLSVFMFCDTAYLTWISSFYEESVIYPSLLMVIACILQLSTGYHKTGKIFALFAGSSVILLTVNDQTMFWGLVTGGSCLLLLYGYRKKKGFSFLGAERGKWYRRACMVMAIAFLGIGMLFQASHGAVQKTEKYHAMTKGMMAEAENPEETAEFFDMDASYGLLKNSSAYERYPVIDVQNQLLEKNFYEKYGIGETILYYMTHGETFGRTMQLMVNQAYTIHGNTGGSYDRTAGREAGEKTTWFQYYSKGKENIVPRALGLILILLVLCWIVNWKNWELRMLFLYLMGTGVALMAVVMIKSGAAESARQLFFYNISFDLFLFFLLSQGFHWIFGRRKKGKNK